MTEPTSDEKIELLVRSVLEAVDARLADVRNEVHQLAADVGQRLHALERRVDAEMANCAGTSAGVVTSDAAGFMERFEAMHQRTTAATNERLDSLGAAIDQIRESAFTATNPGPSTSMMQGLDEMNAPLKMPPITGQQPVLLDEPPLLSSVLDQPRHGEHVEDAPAAVALDEPAAESSRDDEPVAPTFHDTTVASTIDEAPAPIDLNQLADLLSERLSSISLPPR